MERNVLVGVTGSVATIKIYDLIKQLTECKVLLTYDHSPSLMILLLLFSSTFNW